MRPVDERVAELLERVRAGAVPRDARDPSAVNEERVEEFIRSIEAHPRRDRVKVVRQELPWWARRTTKMNYVFEVAGRRPDRLVLVAHYDTWGGPGADDNTTGEEILKQYLLQDLDAPKPPEHTRVYFLAGSEECGLIGFASQILVALLFWTASLALSTGNVTATLVALALVPALKYRFGVAGSRYYVRSLSEEELRRIRAVISVDSVGEGRLYFPGATLGADMVRAVVPYSGSDALDDMLKEIAHARAIRYNTHLAGGTTDHLSFLEVNRSLPRVCWETLKWAGCRLTGRRYVPPFTIQASAIVAMCPGKASAFILGGKLHTPRDTADRVYPEPLRETLQVLDDFFARFDQGARPRRPRRLEDCHFARLYELSDGRAVVALKDAVEPNERNVNLLATGRLDGGEIVVDDVVDWGNEESLDREVAEFCAAHGLRWRRRRVERLVVRDGETRAVFERCGDAWVTRVLSWCAGRFEALLGRYSFLAMFGAAVVVGHLCTWFFIDVLMRWDVTLEFAVGRILLLTLLSLVAQIAILIRLFTKHFPTWMDNAYKNLNRADNLGSLRRRALVRG